MKVIPTDLKEVLIVEPPVFGDTRGRFMETYQKKRYAELGIPTRFVQDNASWSVKNTLRGLHYQHPHSQAKLVQVLKGEVYDVAVDIRKGSPTFGQWVGVHLSEDNHRQLYVPQGFAHGFAVLSDFALFTYKCSDYYAPEAEGGIQWNDPELKIQWPMSTPLLSDKDGRYPALKDVHLDRLPVLGEMP